MKPALLFTLAAPLVLVPLLTTRAPATGQASSLAVGIVAEPVLIFDVTGGSFGGPIHVNMVVYNNGFVSYASDASFIGGDIVTLQQVNPTEIHKLVHRLDRAGSDDLGDSLFPVSDLPLTTITFLNGSTNSPSHSFTYNAAIGPYGAVATVISDFVAQHVNTLPSQ